MANETTVERTRRAFVPDEAWLAKQAREEILEPDLPIFDPHHHLWDRPGNRYLLDELLADTGSGHNIEARSIIECRSMYRADGPGGDAAGGRDRVRQRRGGDERQRPLRPDARLRRHRRPCRPDAGRARRARCWRPISPPATAASAASATPAGWDAEPRGAQQPHEPAAGPDGRGGLPRGLCRSSARSASPSRPGSTIRSSTS